MKATELRIGNLYEYRIFDELDERKKWWEVSKIDAMDLAYLEGLTEDYKDFRPIPLTEEWLIKFGFEQVSDNFFALNYSLNSSMEGIGFDDYDYSIHKIDDQFICGMSEININYVHQLQNLYFALTNTELIWNGEK